MIVRLAFFSWQAVDERAQIKRPLRFLPTVTKLPRDAEAVGRVPGHGLDVFRRWRTVEQIKTQRPVFDPMPQHVDHTAPGDLPLQAGKEFLPRHAMRVLGIADAKLRIRVRLCGLEKGKQMPGIHRIFAIVVQRMARKPTRTAVGR